MSEVRIGVTEDAAKHLKEQTSLSSGDLALMIFASYNHVEQEPGFSMSFECLKKLEERPVDKNCTMYEFEGFKLLVDSILNDSINGKVLGLSTLNGVKHITVNKPLLSAEEEVFSFGKSKFSIQHKASEKSDLKGECSPSEYKITIERKDGEGLSEGEAQSVLRVVSSGLIPKETVKIH